MFAALTTIGVSAVEFNTNYYEYNGEEGVTITGFYGLNGGETVVIPATIEGKKVLAIGLDGVVTTMCIPGAEKIGALDLTQAKNLKIVLPFAFYGCSNINGTIESNTVEVVGEQAFRFCTKLRSFKASNLKAVGVAAFYRCENLVIEISNKCTYIEYLAFDGVKELIKNSDLSGQETVEFETEPIWFGGGLGKISGVAITSIKNVPDNGMIIIPNKIGNEPVLALGNGNTSLLSTTNEENDLIYLDLSQAGMLIKINDRAFKNNINLKSVASNSVELIGSSAFSGCESLERAYFPYCSKVDDLAFFWCPNLKSITLISGCWTGSQAFDYVHPECTIKK